MIVTLTLLNGPRKNSSLALRSPGRYVIGSGELADFRIAREEDPYVAGEHALLDVAALCCKVVSLAGTNPLIVNGDHVRERVLANGHTIQVGLTRIGVQTLLPWCYRCGETGQDLVESADSDGRFWELNEIAVYSHPACLTPDHSFSGKSIAGMEIQRSWVVAVSALYGWHSTARLAGSGQSNR
jgi:hypothetical protein